MNKYSKYVNKNTPLDNEIVRAAARFATAISDGQSPNPIDLKILAAAFFEIFGGRSDVEIFGKSTNMRTQKNGRPQSHGYTSDDVISAHIEITRRVLERMKHTKALTKAKKLTAQAFELNGDPVNIERAINRHWENGKKFVSNLDTRTLRSIINPYRKDKK